MASQNDPRLIADQFEVDFASPLPDAAGGVPAFAAIDRHTGNGNLMAVAVHRRAPPRVRALQVLAGQRDGLLGPLAHGVCTGPDGRSGCYVIAPAPPGPPLAATLQPWTEHALIHEVLRPAAHALEQLERAGLTHRAIRLNNVFQPRPGHPVILGQAWAAPPAMHQPALFEPPYSAMCLPAGRGDGTIADDVYALGALLVALAVGRVPMAGLDDAAVLHRKVELGSFHAIADDARLSPIIADLARGMLAEDPDHRPSPRLLLDPAAARGRRVAARPPRRAQRPLSFAGVPVWDARTLAYAIACGPEPGLQALTGGAIMQWLRRGLGDSPLGSRIEDMVRHRHTDGAEEAGADALLLMRVIVMLDPLAPLCWRGIALWPDGVGPALAAALGTDAATTAHIEEVIVGDVVPNWAMLRPDRSDLAMLRLEARQHRAVAQSRGPAGGLPRLVYTLCPSMPCASPMIAQHWVSQVADMPLALESAALIVDHAISPVDAHVAAFLAARSERRLESETNGLHGGTEENGVALARLRLLAQLQLRYYQKPLPALCTWVAEHCQPLVDSWHNRPRRAVLATRLQAMAQAGFLPPIVGLFEDAEARAEDALGAERAIEAVDQFDRELRHHAEAGTERAMTARRIGQEIAAGVGLTALATVLALAVLG